MVLEKGVCGGCFSLLRIYKKCPEPGKKVPKWDKTNKARFTTDFCKIIVNYLQ